MTDTDRVRLARTTTVEGILATLTPLIGSDIVVSGPGGERRERVLSVNGQTVLRRVGDRRNRVDTITGQMLLAAYGGFVVQSVEARRAGGDRCLKCNRVHDPQARWTHDALTRNGYVKHPQACACCGMSDYRTAEGGCTVCDGSTCPCSRY